MKRRPAEPRPRKPARQPIAAESPLTPYDPNAAAIDVGATSHSRGRTAGKRCRERA